MKMVNFSCFAEKEAEKEMEPPFKMPFNRQRKFIAKVREHCKIFQEASLL